jgi:transposase InsO family protein
MPTSEISGQAPQGGRRGLPNRPVQRDQLLAAVEQALARSIRALSMDVTRDMLDDGRAFRTLNIVHDFTRECVAIELDRSLPGARVVRVLTRLAAERGLPSAIVLDNGPEFVGPGPRRLGVRARRRAPLHPPRQAD